MKRSIKKLISIFLCLLIFTLSVSPAAMAAVAYPEGVTKQQAQQIIPKMDTIIYSLLKQMENKTLKELLLPEIYSSKALSELTVSIYSMIEQQGESISSLGVDVSVAGVAKQLVTSYPGVAGRLMAYQNWSQVNLEGADWGVNDKQSFYYAVAAVLSPFNDILYALLCSGNYSINALIGIKGANGYETAIIPTLKALGCEYITEPTVFYEDAAAYKNTMIFHIIADALTLIEKVLDAPFDVLTDILPGIAHYFKNGGFDSAVSTLIEPLSVQILNIPTSVKVESLLSFVEDAENFTQNFSLDLNAMMGDSGFKMAEIDLDTLASCGTVSGDTVISDKADTFMYLLRYMIETLKLNDGNLSGLMGESTGETSEMTDMLSGIIAKPTDDLIKLLFKVLMAEGAVVYDYQWNFPAITPATVTYTANLGADKYQRVVDGIDELINEFIAEGGEHKTAREALQGEIYSNTLVSELVCGVYSMLESEEMKAVAGVIGIDITPSSLANSLTQSQFKTSRNKLYNYRSFSSINKETLTWGFKNGDKDGFINAVCSAFRPLEGILNMFLAEGKIQVFGCVDIYGSNGYNTAIIPLLEALGCSQDSIKTYDEFKYLSAKGNGFEAIVQAVCSLIERILDRPVYTVIEILPNLLYNVNNGVIKACVENLIYPFTDMLTQLGISEVIDLSAIEKLDVKELIGEFAGGADLGINIDLESIDLNQFASMGQAVSVQSKRTQGGQFANITYIKSDMPAIAVTLLRYMVEIMKAPGNEDLLTGFMGGSGEEGSNDMFATYSEGIGEQLATMTTDETVEWLYKLFFRERAVVEQKPQEEYMPTIKYEAKEETSAAGTALLVIFALLALAEIIAIKKRDKISSFLEDRKLKKSLKEQSVNQEV